MSFYKKTIKDIDLKNKKVLIRVDYNVPLKEGKIIDDYRIKKSLPTLNYLLEQECKIIICSHLGRPKSPDDKQFSLEPLAERLAKLIDKDVVFVPDCVGEVVQNQAANLKSKQLLLLDNLRFHPEEEANDGNFSKQLADLAEIFIQDGFGVVHRAHASTVGVTKYLPSVSGLLLENEVDTITNAMEKPKRPLVAIVGGAKIADKIEILSRFIDLADVVAVGGAMANTFLLAKGIKIGSSLADPENLAMAKDIIDKAKAKTKNNNFIFYVPQDGVVATSTDKTAKTRVVDWDADVFAEVEAYPKKPERSSAIVKDNEEILDIGPFSGAFMAGTISLSESVIWNGTLGVTETQALNGPIGPFSHGTELIIDALTGAWGHKPYSLIGGGDTAGYIEERKLVEAFNHVSTGGGASLELMAGHKLPGVEALLNKEN